MVSSAVVSGIHWLQQQHPHTFPPSLSSSMVYNNMQLMEWFHGWLLLSQSIGSDKLNKV